MRIGLKLSGILALVVLAAPVSAEVVRIEVLSRSDLVAGRFSTGLPMPARACIWCSCMTRATASAICFHCDSSATSCFLPLGVNR